MLRAQASARSVSPFGWEGTLGRATPTTWPGVVPHVTSGEIVLASIASTSRSNVAPSSVLSVRQ